MRPTGRARALPRRECALAELHQGQIKHRLLAAAARCQRRPPGVRALQRHIAPRVGLHARAPRAFDICGAQKGCRVGGRMRLHMRRDESLRQGNAII